jgi:hypothetical protein
VLGITVELALVVHDHIEVTFEEDGRSWWVCYVGFTGSLARPGASVVVIFSIEIVHYCVLSVNQFVDVGHEVANGFGISFVDLFEQLDVGDFLFVVGNDVVIFEGIPCETYEGIAVLEVAVGVLTKSFVASHPYSSEVVCIAMTIVGHLVVGHE